MDMQFNTLVFFDTEGGGFELGHFEVNKMMLDGPKQRIHMSHAKRIHPILNI